MALKNSLKALLKVIYLGVFASALLYFFSKTTYELTIITKIQVPPKTEIIMRGKNIGVAQQRDLITVAEIKRQFQIPKGSYLEYKQDLFGKYRLVVRENKSNSYIEDRDTIILNNSSRNAALENFTIQIEKFFKKVDSTYNAHATQPR